MTNEKTPEQLAEEYVSSIDVFLYRQSYGGSTEVCAYRSFLAGHAAGRASTEQKERDLALAFRKLVAEEGSAGDVVVKFAAECAKILRIEGDEVIV